MVETFVDPSRFKGTCYRAAGWVPLGSTSGYGRRHGVYYYHGQPKTVLVKPLSKKAPAILSAPFLPPELMGGERAMVDLNTVSIESRGGLLYYLSLLQDSRKKRGIRHPQVSVLAVAICALLSGARCFIAVGEWAADLNQEMLKRLGCRYNERLEKFAPPSEKTLRLTLQRVDGDEVDDIVGQWLYSQSQDRVVAVDGKTLRGSAGADGKQVHLVSAFLQHERMVIGQRLTRTVENWHEEIFAYFDLLPTPITNAYTEQLNGIIKLINKNGRGYKFEVLRAKILFSEGVHKIITPKFNRHIDQGMANVMLLSESGEEYQIRDLGVDMYTLIQMMEEGSFFSDQQ